MGVMNEIGLLNTSSNLLVIPKIALWIALLFAAALAIGYYFEIEERKRSFIQKCGSKLTEAECEVLLKIIEPIPDHNHIS